MAEHKSHTHTGDLWHAFETGATQVFMPVFDSIQEGIEIVDAAGIVRYVNPSFEAILGIKASGRVGKSIFQLVPDGTLAKVLRSGRSLLGERLYIADAGMDIIVNTSPIIINGEMIGAIAIFQGFNEVSRLITQLNKSKKLVEVLDSKLSNAMSAKYSFDTIIGRSSSLMQSISAAKKVAKTEASVLVVGETGTGKELFAHAIHQASHRCHRPFVKLNCAAVPFNLMESEFFGYEKGAFTGAAQRKLGMFDIAASGTIFLDEIGELDLQLQSKLLRILEEGEMYRVGGTKPVAVDVRVIAATNRSLIELVREGRFREDLFYRLNVITIEIPPLRHRQKDIPLLVRFFIDWFSRKHGKKIDRVTSGAEELLYNYSWPGNVRELKNTIQQAVIMAEGPEITIKELEPLLRTESNIDLSNQIIPLEEMEQRMIKTALNEFGHSLAGKKKAAAALNISIRTLYNKIQKYGL